MDWDQRKKCNRDFGGMPHKLSLPEERRILQTLSSLRHKGDNFTSIRLVARAGISPKHASNRTVRQFFQWEGYYFLQARKKGLLSEKGLKRMLKMCQKYQKRLLKGFVERQCSFLFRLRLGLVFGIKGTQQIKPVRLTAVFGTRSVRVLCVAALQRGPK